MGMANVGFVTDCGAPEAAATIGRLPGRAATWVDCDITPEPETMTVSNWAGPETARALAGRRVPLAP